MQGKSAMTDTFKEYILVRDLDMQNERRPNRSGNTSSLRSSITNDSLLI